MVAADKVEGGYEFIVDHIARFGSAPTVREVSEALGLKSSRSGYTIINTLVAQGRLAKDMEGAIRVPES